MKYVFMMLLLAAGIGATAQTPTGTKGDLPLPEGVFVKEGKLAAKEGYTLKLTVDKRKAELRNTATNRSVGTFVCDCSIIAVPQGSCYIIITDNILSCNNLECGYCLLTYEDVTGINYLVHLGTGTMQRK